VIEGGVPELPTTLPLEEIGQALRAGDVEVDLSVDAGGYVCNYGFYTLQHLAKKLGVGRSGLVHLPSTERYRARNNRDLDTHQAVEIVTTILMEG
jgi:pyrrolidone-carboxylate peptidase